MHSALADFECRQAKAAESAERVWLKHDHEAKMWVVSGRGVTLRFRSYELADAEALRRVGFSQQVAAPVLTRRSRP